MNIYFSGVGGVGIGPLALLALDAGYSVSGSDLHHSAMVPYLEERGAKISIGQDGSNIAAQHNSSPIDWFVYSSALPDNHPELVFAKTHGIKISKRSEFINHIVSEKKLRLIAVSGTHGKTTTTGMLIWIFKQLGIPISYSIGTSISFGPPAQYQVDSEYFIYECDEFDRNFLDFKPSFSFIPSLGFDHPDTYSTVDDYNHAFSEFINQSQVTFMWQASATQLNMSLSSSKIILSPSDPGKNTVTLPGEIMRQNGWLAIQGIRYILGMDPSKTLAHVNSFPGTGRRFEELSDNLYTDYAHHPVEIKATIAMAKEFNKNIIVVYQPHQNIRQHEILNNGGYKDTFSEATKVYWLPTFLSREYQNIPEIAQDKLINTLDNPDVAEISELNDSLFKKIEEHRGQGDLVVAMSAGDLDSWLKKQLSTN